MKLLIRVQPIMTRMNDLLSGGTVVFVVGVCWWCVGWLVGVK